MFAGVWERMIVLYLREIFTLYTFLRVCVCDRDVLCVPACFLRVFACMRMCACVRTCACVR